MGAPDFEIRARREPFHGLHSIEVLITSGDSIARPLVFERHEGLIHPPTIDAGYGEAFLRAALNCAWEMGMRPDGYEDTRESMKATNAHLQDMRAIAFQKVGAEKP